MPFQLPEMFSPQVDKNGRNGGNLTSESSWDTNALFRLSDEIIAGRRLTVEEVRAILQAPDTAILEILAAAYRVRRHFHGMKMRLNMLINAKSGLCGEDCAYCSQSKISTASIAKYPLLDEDVILAGAAAAVERKASTYCIAIAGRSPNPREMERLCQTISRIKERFPLKVCLSPGLLTLAQAEALKKAGLDRVNHNLNTGRRFYREICSTHTYEDRLATLKAARQAGLELCCGGIIGMGEGEDDLIDFILALGELRPESVPINFLIPIAGTPLEGRPAPSPLHCLKVLSLIRFATPTSDLRIAAGREVHLGPLQPLGLFVANSIFVGDYLTTKGQPPEEDYRMIAALGFEIEQVIHGESAAVCEDTSPAPVAQ